MFFQDLVAKVNELTSMCNNQKSELSRLSEQESGSEVIRSLYFTNFSQVIVLKNIFFYCFLGAKKSEPRP